MEKKNDGGSAFPIPCCPALCNEHGHNIDVDEGMSLRDWFAGRAMQGLLSAGAGDGMWNIGKTNAGNWHGLLAAKAFQISDEM